MGSNLLIQSLAVILHWAPRRHGLDPGELDPAPLLLQPCMPTHATLKMPLHLHDMWLSFASAESGWALRSTWPPDSDKTRPDYIVDSCCLTCRWLTAFLDA